MKKVITAAVVVLVLFPVIPYLTSLIPKPFTMERFQEALKAQEFVVERVQPVTPMNGAVEQYSLGVLDAEVEVYRFVDEGRIVTQMSYEKPDIGEAMVESSGLREAMGAAKNPNKPVSVDRNGMFMIIVRGENAALRQRIVAVFTKT